MTKSVYCAVCNSARECAPLFNESHEYQLYQCSDCGLVFLYPVPKNAMLEELYSGPGSYYLPVATYKLELRKFKLKFASLRFKKFIDLKQHDLLKDYICELLAATIEVLSGRKIPYTMGIPKLMPKDAAILEIGYGNGSWLLTMHNLGYSNLFGVEINHTAQSMLLEKQINAQVGAIQDIDFPDEFFDIIRLEHVFEHLPDPLERLQTMARWLKTTGYIVMNVPNIESLTFKLFGPYTTFLNLPEHIFQYSLKSIENLAHKCGLIIARYRTIGVWPQFTTSLLCRRETLLAKLINHPLANIFAPIYGLLVSGRGEFLSVILSKTDRASKNNK